MNGNSEEFSEKIGVLYSLAYAPALIDCGILCQNITLASTSLGIANIMCGFTGLAFASGSRTEEFSKRLGFPDGYAFGCSVLLGYANTVRPPHVPDKDKIKFIYQ